VSSPAVRAESIAKSGGVSEALQSGLFGEYVDLTASEALVLGLLRQGVKKYCVILGHGNTDLGNVLRIYAQHGVVSVTDFRSEIEMTHAATALRWVTGESVAVVTSIGPGALQALSASLTAASNGVGVWHIYGDETTHDEGYNMQQVPGVGQSKFASVVATFGHSYQLHTPEAITECLRRGSVVTNHPVRPQPFYVVFPINVQPQVMQRFNIARLPEAQSLGVAPALPEAVTKASATLRSGSKVVIKVGRGATGAGAQVLALAERLDAVCVLSPSSVGIIPASHPRCMGVGGSKGSISGNYAMENADTLIVIGSRAVCQSDCSRTGYPRVDRVVNINADLFDAAHYNNTIALVGDVTTTLESLNEIVEKRQAGTPWLDECAPQLEKWREYLAERTNGVTPHDTVWGRTVLTQPSAISQVLSWAQGAGHRVFFDAGDVQAHGFQVVQAEREGWFYTDSGASYMGFAASAVLAGGVADEPFYSVALTGDGSFVMNPQVLVDAIHTGTKGCVVVFDNRRMAAISSLQKAQYGVDFETADGVAVDYVGWAKAVPGVNGIGPVWSPQELESALGEADRFDGLTLIHVPVYFGDDPHGSLGAFGRWNVGPWVHETQRLVMEGKL
jgi:3D-(3,5/4)-trihydroxycyclohexane-1,2-dione acylhydrolase (decyclizing)